jgi:hypothetical protein
MIIALLCLAMAAFPFALTLANLPILRSPGPPGNHNRISVLIPARNEAANIATALDAVLKNTHSNFEVIVLDDGSTDGTAAIVHRFTAQDARVRLESAPPLPAGWCGKMFACNMLSNLASGDLLVFIDADVALAQNALTALDGFMNAHPSIAYASGVPRQITATFAEKLIVPLINFLLVAFLPIAAMRRDINPGYGAGCGQLVVVRAQDYRTVGGHAAIRRTLHDGLMLPRLFREKGLATDLFDGTEVATCHMYSGCTEVWRGFGKNAREGLATIRALPLWTIILGLGQIAPYVLLAIGIAPIISLTAALVSLATRLLITGRTRGSWLGAACHPLGILALLAIQWAALARGLLKQPSLWRGREYT